MADEFKVNADYAKRYTKWRQQEELQRLKSKYQGVSDSSSSSETEDEDAGALTEKLEGDWLRTLAALKRKDPKIYQKDVIFYQSSSDSDSTEIKAKKMKKKKDKPLFIKDYDRKVILEKQGHLADEDTDEDVDVQKPGYYEEQEEIRKGFKSALADSSSDSESGDSGLLQPRAKTKDSEQIDEEDYLNWLRSRNSAPTKDKEDLVSLKDYWFDPKLEKGEKFLRDYILNKGYLDKAEGEGIPTYDEVVDEEFSDEEQTLEKQETFERKYNFRYEEPDTEFIKSFPRTIDDSVRRKDDKRSKKRKEVKDRKKTEKEKKHEELKQYKNLKKREIMDKIERLKAVTGNPSVGFNEKDLEEDFDPQRHDDMMQKVFDDEYYRLPAEAVKPEYEDKDGLGLEENYDDWQRDVEQNEPHVDDPDFNMDADFNPTVQRKTKSNKRKSKFAQALAKQKPLFNEKETSFEEYFNEYYNLDYEDLIDDMPCRFKYRKVTPMNFGLDVNEILTCSNKELNSWCSVKKMSQYRTTEEEEYDIKSFNIKAANKRKKANILTSLKSGNLSEHAVDRKAEVPMSKKQKRRKSKGKSAPVATITSSDQIDTQSLSLQNVNIKTKLAIKTVEKQSIKSDGQKIRKQKEKHKLQEETTTQITLENKTAIGNDNLDKPEKNEKSIMPSEKRKKKNKKKKQDTSVSENNEKSVMQNEKRKKKKKQDTSLSENNEKSEMKSEKQIKKKEQDTSLSENNEKSLVQSEKRKKKNKKKKPDTSLSEERLKAYGINPKKFKYMKIRKHDVEAEGE